MLTASDLFAGAGGSSEGLVQAGYDVQICANPTWVHYPEAGGYYVSDLGDIRGPRGWVLSPETLKDGYRRVNMRGRHVLVHRAVVRAFRGVIPDGLEVNHVDGDKSNNRLGNLEVVSPSENVRHSIDLLKVTRSPGEKNGNAKLTEIQVLAIRSASLSGETNRSIANRFGTTAPYVWQIVTRRAWRHI